MQSHSERTVTLHGNRAETGVDGLVDSIVWKI